MRPLTEAIPKPLVPLNGKPCLQHILEGYIRKGYHHFVLCTGYRGEAIVDFVRSQSFDAEIEFSDSGEDVSMLQRIYDAKSLVRGERSFIAYGDILIDLDLEEMLVSHLSSGAKVTITTAEVRSPFGLLHLDSDRWIDSFQEKPILPYYVGHMLVETTTVNSLTPELLQKPDGQGVVALFQELAAKRKLRSYPYRGPQITFNTHSELDKAERDFKAFFTHVEGDKEI